MADASTWVHPTHGRTLHPPEQHLRTLSKIRHVAAASSAPSSHLDISGLERLLLAIFGLKDGETVEQAVAEMRAAAANNSAEPCFEE